MTNETLGGINRFDTTTVKNLVVTGTLTTTGSITDGSDLTLANGKAIQTDTTTAHTAVFKAYDVDGTAYKTFATLTNGNTPSFAIAAPAGGTVSIDGAVIGATAPTTATFSTANITTAATMTTAAATVILKQGSNGKTGTFTMNGVTPVSVSNTSITANSGIIFTLKTVGGTVGAYPAIQTITPTTGFTVAGTALDTSVYNYHIVESAA